MGTDMWGAFKGMTPQAAPFTPARTAPQGQAAEMEGAQRTMEGLVERMFASAGGRQAELADAARVLEGQAAEVRRPAVGWRCNHVQSCAMQLRYFGPGGRVRECLCEAPCPVRQWACRSSPDPVAVPSHCAPGSALTLPRCFRTRSLQANRSADAFARGTQKLQNAAAALQEALAVGVAGGNRLVLSVSWSCL